MSASGESSTTMHRLLHASGSYPIPPPNDPKRSIGVPSSKILTDKTVHRYIAVIDKSGAQDADVAPKVMKAPKKRTAAVPDDVPVAKRKRTTKKKVSLSKDNLELMTVAQEVVPIQMIEGSTAPAADDTADQPAAVDAFPADRPAEEIESVERIDEQLTAEPAVEVSRINVDDPEIIIQQVLDQLDSVTEDPVVAKEDRVIDEVAQFFNSFSLKKLATINIEEMYKKEEQVLSWGETESPQLAIQRKLYILLKYREVLVQKFLESWRSNFVPGQGSSAVDLRVIDLLSYLHLFILEELTKEARAHGLSWKKPTMLRVDGAWLIEPCADRWVKIPQLVIYSEVPRQRQYVDTLPPVNNFFKTLTKRWADICLEVVEFCASKRLLPVGSLQFCRSVSVIEPVFRVAPRQSSAFALRVSQFGSVFIDFSLFSWLPTADITDFLSSIALNRTAFRSAQISQNTVSVAPSAQLSLDQRLSSPTSADSSSSLHFDTTDLDATASSLPSVSIDFSAALADFQVILSEQINESQSGISSRLHKIEHGLRDSQREQAEVFKNLFQEARQEGRTIDDVQTLCFNEFRKNILAQNASIFTGLADVRKEVQEVNASVDILASCLNDVQYNIEATNEALSHQLLEFQSQAQENQNILHAQLSELVNYINRGSADKKGESSSRGPQQPPNVQIRDSGTCGDSAVRTPTFAQRAEMAQRRIVENFLDADRNSESLERQAATERDRERRRREARMLKRRRKF
ncbi:hypothetical protein F511_31304 [Dorcoceras hygrometricum]|uniref:Uncharacterized protein n=1 Tax=Dorcoceras hygrometricum TaxID=472368 RepID=A0A2Z7AYY8_9LAMI|nr:hypothetical protein F511_31304 [Dorcoceras hygrometricum]